MTSVGPLKWALFDAIVLAMLSVELGV